MSGDSEKHSRSVGPQFTEDVEANTSTAAAACISHVRQRFMAHRRIVRHAHRLVYVNRHISNNKEATIRDRKKNMSSLRHGCGVWLCWAQRIPKDPKSAWGHPMMLTYSCRGRLGPTNCFPRYQEPSFLRWLTRNTHPWTSSKYLFLFLLINLPEHIGKFANMLHQSIRMFIPSGIYHHITKSRLATESKASLKPRNLSPSNLNKLRHLKVKSWNRDMLYVGWFL